ncbi:insertion sequence IS5376 ATP-binding protein [Bordetella trematum]|uniref:Insertion sequence IS5376 ATP-binding protein n=1 Tax=Bordetella trematum TaxID=123899 RepID=A0A157KX83_9BORD|nr:ATP-binding protein [Bordetella trematum]NNH18664.1 ATP-binding protein [Bordetella trematum]SAH88609.1 insertion sequence IS5376 ATP-binding protein [Bordetella trematum]SAI66545.1 insertion sequence IS5376 ATP-binding protein [Bordetella trematum]SUV96556.1 insertion sequence IS5376 ATP-binding protein [Bordetella trematum]
MEISTAKTTAAVLTTMAGFNFETEARHCPEHGEFMAMKTPVGWSDCTVCNAKRQQAERFRVEAEATRATLMRQADVPVRYHGKTLDTYHAASGGGQGIALGVAVDYADSFAEARASGRGLIFCGKPGTGKTHLAIGIIHRVLAAGYSARFAVVLDAMQAVKSTYRKDAAMTEAAVIEKLTAPDLLVLDEIGNQYGTDSERIILSSVINTRYNAMKPTILLSNLAKEQLVQELGERVMDRMREGGGRMVIFDWASHRGVKV